MHTFSLKPIEALLKLISKYGLPKVLVAVVITIAMTAGIAYFGQQVLKRDTTLLSPTPSSTLDPTVIKDGCLEGLLDELKMEILQFIKKNKNKDEFKDKILNIKFVID